MRDSRPFVPEDSFIFHRQIMEHRRLNESNGKVVMGNAADLSESMALLN